MIPQAPETIPATEAPVPGPAGATMRPARKTGPLSATDRPLLPRGVRLHDDRVRGVPVLLGPEIALILDPIGQAILTEVDGQRDIASIAATLAARYSAPEDEVRADIIEFLDGMVHRRLVEAL